MHCSGFARASVAGLVLPTRGGGFYDRIQEIADLAGCDRLTVLDQCAMSRLLSSHVRRVVRAVFFGCVVLCLDGGLVQAWQDPPNRGGLNSSPTVNLRKNRESELLSRPVEEILQGRKDLLPVDAAPKKTETSRLTSEDIFLLKICGALLMISVAVLVGLKVLFSHGRKSRNPIVGPSPMGSGPPDPDGLRWLSGTVRSVTNRQVGRRRNPDGGSSDSQDAILVPPPVPTKPGPAEGRTSQPPSAA